MTTDPQELRRSSGLSDRWSAVAGRPERTIEIRDPQAIRAIAHEARQQVIDVLFAATRRTFTATELAELTGLSPSAMSYHLRALEKWGVIERADTDNGDGRNRPWRAAGTRLEVRSGTDPSAQAASSILLDQALRQLRERVLALQQWPPEHRSSFVGSGQAELWLTEEEAARFVVAIERAELELMESGIDNQPGPDKVRTRWFFSLLPTPGQQPPAGNRRDDRRDDSVPKQNGPTA